MIAKGIVGKKGELFPPKEIRDELGLKSGDEVVYRVEKSRLIIEPVPDILTAIKMPKFAKTTVKEFEEERQQLAAEVVER
jgi:AbrB family looped-hinge helix DNA binding protein